MDFYAISGTGVEFYGQTEDKVGVDRGFAVQEVDGLGPVAILADDTASVGDGDLAGPARYGAREITITGLAIADNERALAGLRATLGALRAVDTLLVEQHGEQRFYRGGWRGQPKWLARYLPSGAQALYQVVFKALNPFGLGERRSVVVRPGNAVRTLTHGNQPAWPTIRLTGPINSGFRFVRGEYGFTINRDVPAGRTWTLDMQTGQLRDHAGALVFGATRGHPVPIGLQSDFLHLIGTGAGSATVVWHDTYN